MSPDLFVRFNVWAAASCVTAVLCFAQPQAQVAGTITDSSGAIVPAATVALKNTATGVVYQTVSNSTGSYVVPFLPPGHYVLTCTNVGFKTFQRDGIVLETGIGRTVDIGLEVGNTADSVTVKAETPMLEAQSSTVGQLIERATVFNMPLGSRRSASLVRLMGAVAFNREDESAEQIPRFSIAGGRSLNQMWFLDGGVVQNMALGNQQLSLNAPAEALQEFKVEANNYAAEFGRTGNGLIIMTTRSGTNEFHGAAYEFLRNDKLDARMFFAATKPPLRYNVFGASLGGPIIKDKTFFFFNYEGGRRRLPLVFSTTIVPHPSETRGDFSARTDLTVIDPQNRQPFPGNIIPAARQDPIGQQLARYYPAPNVASNNIRLAPANNFLSNGTDALTQDFYTARVDHNFGARNRLFGRFSYARGPQTTAPVFPSEVAFADSRGAQEGNRHVNWTVSWLRNFTPAVINEVQYLYGDRLYRYKSVGVGSGKNKELGITGVDPDYLSTINAAGLVTMGARLGAFDQTPIRTHQITDHITWIKGNHSIKTGFDYRNTHNRDGNREAAGGTFTFSALPTGSGLASLLLGWTTSASVTVPFQADAHSAYYGAFVQDDWRVTPRLTLNLGVRWEMDTPKWNEENRQSWFDPTLMNPVSNTLGAIVFAGRDGASKYGYDFDKDNLGPRVGFAYRAAPGFVVRGGYGLAYNGPYIGSVASSLSNGFDQAGSFTSPDGGLTPAFLLRTGMPPTAPNTLDAGYGAVPVGQSPRISPDFFQKNHQSSYSQQWNLTMQKELPGRALVEWAYMANIGRKLAGSDTSINMIPLVNGRGPAVQDQRLRPYPQYSGVIQRSPPWGNSTYHAMNVKLEKRYSGGLNFLMNYTWSKFINDVFDIAELGATPSNFTHVELRRANRSLAGNDLRHRYIASTVYELPIGRGRAWNISNPVADAVIGGWGIGAIAEFRTGSPYGFSELVDRSNTFAVSNRPVLLRNPEIASDRSRGDMLAQYYDTSAFAAPAPTEFGNTPRYMNSGPGLISVDASVNKRWRITERVGLLFRSDFYNLPNRPNFANPNGVRGRGDFGRITSLVSGATGRRIQFSLRLEF